MVGDVVRRARPFLGTIVEITAEGGGAHVETAIEHAFAAVGHVHDLMSFHAPDSDVSRLNREAGCREVTVHADTYAVLSAALDLFRRSKGLFDITVAPILQTLGLLPGDPCARADARARGAGGEPLRLGPCNRVRFNGARIAIDLGGIAKGHAVDQAIAALRRSGLAAGLVNAGGDLAAFGPAPSIVHVRDPRDPGRILTEVAVCEGAMASSGGRFDPVQSALALSTAIIDPISGVPAQLVLGATVCAPSCMMADALTKVVMLAGEDTTTILAHYGASALVVPAKGDITVTSNWQSAVSRAA